MSRFIQSYREHGKTYQADRCRPLVQAVSQGKLRLEALAREGYPGRSLKPGQLPGVLSLGFWDAPGCQDWGLELHRNEGIELTFQETGSNAFFVNQRKHLLEAGDLTITRPWQPHRVGDPFVLPGRLHFIILDVKVRLPHQRWQWPDWMILSRQDLEQLTRLLSRNENPVWHSSPEIAACFQKIGSLIAGSPSPVANLSLLTVLLNQLFIYVLQMLREKNISLNHALISSQRTVKLFLEDLRRDLPSLARPWTAAAMAKSCDLGVTHFTHLCKKITNMTPLQYLNYYRIDKAARLLRQHPEKSITDIAFACGFRSSQYFATVFRQFKKCAPGDCRKSQKD